MQIVKDANLLSKMWGTHVHVSEVVDKESTPSEIEQLIKVVQIHKN